MNWLQTESLPESVSVVATKERVNDRESWSLIERKGRAKYKETITNKKKKEGTLRWSDYKLNPELKSQRGG